MTNSSHDKGFAPAAGAIEDGAIHTSLQGLEAGDAVLPCGAPAYYAMPEEGRNLPVVLVAQEIFGLHEHIRDIVRRFGKLGYFAIAPDFIIRYGDPSTAQDIDAIREIVAKVPDSETMMIFDEALDFAESRGGDRSRAAVTGFCWGGRIAWLYAAHNPQHCRLRPLVRAARRPPYRRAAALADRRRRENQGPNSRALWRGRSEHPARSRGAHAGASRRQRGAGGHHRL